MLNALGWGNLDQKRNYTKSMFMYKITNDHADPNLKQFFRIYSEGDTDLVLPKPKRECGKRSFEYNGVIHWKSLSNEAKNTLVHLREL